MRDNQEASDLSEGETNLIAFCYFMAKLEDIETKGRQPIIWIDDPVSSLDTNHIFFIYSLINAKIVSPQKYTQIFISTHNLDFLKYLRRLPGATKEKEKEKSQHQYFLINREYLTSKIILMPRYLKDYATEFNFLFHQIHKCAHPNIKDQQNYDCYYTFGNNTRKFLEAFLSYKYPDPAKCHNNKLKQFFKNEELAKPYIQRITNESSHLVGAFDRNQLPNFSEMKKAAELILKKIKENDPDQYESLLQSVGIK